MFCGVDQPQFCQDAKEASCNDMFPNDETLITDLPFLHATDFEKDSNVSNWCPRNVSSIFILV